jgi:hypothetical protein
MLPRVERLGPHSRLFDANLGDLVAFEQALPAFACAADVCRLSVEMREAAERDEELARPGVCSTFRDANCEGFE